MTTWKLMYENRFPRKAAGLGTIFDHHRAAAGTQSLQSGPAFIMFTGFHGLGIGEGRNLTYRLDAVLEDVIGVDVSVEIAFIGLFEGRPLTLFSTEASGLSAVLEATEPPTSSGHTMCRLTLRLDDAVTTIDGVRFRQRFGLQQLERRRMQVRWTTYGQLQVWLDGLLIAYENAVKPGHRFNLGRLAIGDVDLPANGVINAAVTGFRLVELREDSAVEALGEQLDPECIPEISERCQKAAPPRLQELLRECRQLMAAFNQSRTTPWRKEDGGNPFSAAALTTHKAGTRAGIAFARFLREGTPESREEVVSHLRTLLGLLAEDQPALFKQLLAKSREAREALDEHCQEAAYEARVKNPGLFEMLDPLGSELEELVEELEGGY
jgi:hypothetical protein